MLKARVSYLGQSEYGKEDRFAVIDAPNSEQDKIEALLDDLGYRYDAFGDSEDAVYYVPVDDKDDYKDFVERWKEAKKAYNTVRNTTKKGANAMSEKKDYAEWEKEKAYELDNSTLKNYIWQLNNHMSVPYCFTSDLALRDVLWERGELPYGYHETRLPKEVYDRYVPIDFRNKYLLAVDEFDEETGQTTTTSIEQLFVKNHGWLDNEEYDELVENSGLDATTFYNENVTHINAHCIDVDGKPSTGDMPVNVYRLMCDRTYDPINKEEYDSYKTKFAEWLQKREKESFSVPGVTAEYKGFNIDYVDYMDAFRVSDKKSRTVGYADTVEEAKEGIDEFTMKPKAKAKAKVDTELSDNKDTVQSDPLDAVGDLLNEWDKTAEEKAVQWCLNQGHGIEYSAEKGGLTTQAELEAAEKKGAVPRYVSKDIVEFWAEGIKNNDAKIVYTIENNLSLLDYDEWDATCRALGIALSWEDSSEINRIFYEKYDFTPLDAPDYKEENTSIAAAFGFDEPNDYNSNNRLDVSDIQAIYGILQKYPIAAEKFEKIDDVPDLTEQNKLER